MLTHLQVQNFIIIDKAELAFNKGLSVITGETGAGKSIIIDALSLVLGARADNNFIGPFQEKCDVIASFDLTNTPQASAWLQQQEYGEAPWQECLIRRILQKDGKSRQMINGYNCTLQQLKEFLALLINIHSQNQHYLLSKRSHQRDLVDSFCNHPELLEQVKQDYLTWHENEQKLETVRQLQQRGAMQQELLEYQITEFEKLALLPEEYEQLDKEHKQLANASQIILDCHKALSQLSGSEEVNAADLLYQAHSALAHIQHYDDKLQSANELINHAIIHLDEASAEIRHYSEQIDLNPERLQTVEARLAKIYELARKYQVKPQALSAIFEKLSIELHEIKDAQNQYQILYDRSLEFLATYKNSAAKLHASRNKAAISLSKILSQQIQELGMPGGKFSVTIESTDQISPHGMDLIEFTVATNPGQTLQPLTKVASGGEVSRIALALYVATARKKTTPILVFDEVDVGIGGGTAAIVGRLLKSLSDHTQVICITHLPQVAAYGDQHFSVKKATHKQQNAATIVALGEEDRITEIARMLGGLTITEKTLAHARELVLAE